MTRYSLSNYILTLTPKDNSIKNIFGSISIGGEGDTLDSISVNQEGTLFSTTGYSTGGWVHSKSLQRNGTFSISLSQLSDKVVKFIRLCEMFYSKDYDGFDITIVSNSENKTVCVGTDCYIASIPNQSFGSSAANQTWNFTAGKITFSV